jgi:hypothetical protein
MRQCPQHAEECERREHCKEHIMQYHECLERTRLAEAIGLVATAAIDVVPEDDGDGVEGTDGDGYFVVQRAIVDVSRYAEG